MPWIHHDGAVGLLTWALDESAVQEQVNTVALQQCEQRIFVRALAAPFGRHAWLQMPAAPLRLLAGERPALLLHGQAVLLSRALADAYRVRFPARAGPLQALAQRPHPADSFVQPAGYR